MKKIALITCVKKKQNHRCRAEDMYTSTLFRRNLQYARFLRSDKIFILSAEHKLLPLSQEIDYYERTLKTFKDQELRAWAEETLAQLRQEADLEKDHFTILAGEKYRKYLVPHLKHYEIPFKGLGFGKQLQALKERLG